MKEKLYPWLKQITLKQIRGFRAVVETGTVSAAARELHLTTPAVSLQLKDLEKAVGLPLLERNSTGLIPTEAGTALMKLALQLKSEMIDFAETISEMRGFDHGVVSVGVVSTARYFAPNVLSDFIKQHPEVNLQLQVGNRDSTLSKLENMEIDIAITGFPPDHYDVVKEFIGRHPQIIIAPPDHPRDVRAAPVRPRAAKKVPAPVALLTSYSNAIKTCQRPASNLAVTKPSNRPLWPVWASR